MSPMVPPISVMTTSLSLAMLYSLLLISLVTWGMICTVPPLYAPPRSLFSTDQKIWPEVTEESRVRFSSMKRS